MPHPVASRKKAASFAAVLFVLGLIVLFFAHNWWPGIMVPLGLSLALRQFLLGRTYDMMISLLVFLGAFASVQYQISWELFLPILFTLGAIYVFFRELIELSALSEAEREEDLNHELEETRKDPSTKRR